MHSTNAAIYPDNGAPIAHGHVTWDGSRAWVHDLIPLDDPRIDTPEEMAELY